MAIDITTTKEESSSDFGTRLLTSVQESNRSKEKAFRKRQKRDERDKMLFGVAGRIGIGLGDSFFKDQTAAFLNTEQMTQNVLTTRNAYKTATTTQEKEAEARKWEGGYDAYWLEQGKLRAQPQLQANFGSIYNKADYINSLLGAGTDIGNKLKEAHEQRLKLTNIYLSSRGVHEGKDAYLTALKETNPQTLSKGITKMLGKFLGLTSGEQISKYASNIYESASELEKFQDAYKQTGDATYADIIARETPRNFRNPAPVIGKEIKFFEQPNNIPGADPIKRPYYDLKIIDRETTITTLQMAFIDGKGNLTGESMSVGHAKDLTTFYDMFEGILSEDKVLSRYRAVIEKLIPDDEQEKLNIEIEAAVKDQLSANATGPKRIALNTGYRDRMTARIGAAASLIQQELGYSQDSAAQVAVGIFLDNPTIDGSGAFYYGAGISTPYNTLKSMIKQTSKARMNAFHVNNLIGKNGRNLVRSYLNASSVQRKVMDKTLAEVLELESPLVPADAFLEMQQVAKTVANLNDKFSKGWTLDQKIEFVQNKRAEQIKEIGKIPTEENPVPVPKSMISDVWEWAKDNPADVALYVSLGLLAIPSGTIGVGGALVLGTGRAAWFLGTKIAPSALKIIKRSFYKQAKLPKIKGVQVEGPLLKPTLSIPRVVAGAVVGERVIEEAVDATGSLLEGITDLPKARLLETDTSDSLLAKPTEVVDNAPKTVEEKVSFVGDIFGDSANAVTFMKRVVNQESRMGKAPGTYEISADGKGSFGVAQIDKVAFDQVQKKLADSKSTIFDYVERFKDATNIDLTTVKHEDLKDDTLSIAFGRLYLMQLTTDPIPETLKEQAAYWKKNYNTVAGAGTVHNFINRNRMKDFK